MGGHVEFEGRCEREEDQKQQVAGELHGGHHVGWSCGCGYREAICRGLYIMSPCGQKWHLLFGGAEAESTTVPLAASIYHSTPILMNFRPSSTLDKKTG